jgi:predicted NBD/HSP70 family sugar kinase/uncharacterized phosphosugar-binding protein
MVVQHEPAASLMGSADGLPRLEPYLGIDVGGTHTKWALLTDGVVQRAGQVATPRTGAQSVLDAISQLYRHHAPEAAGIGVAMPGLVDGVRRETLFVPNIPGEWEGTPVGAELEARCGVPVLLLNDARAFGHAELSAGGARGELAALFIALGTGVGGAVARDGRIVMDDVDAVGEIGHQVVDPRGERCRCGGTGCLETVASGPAIVRAVEPVVADGRSGLLAELTGGRVELLTPELIARAADEGDPWAVAAFDRAGGAIGIAAVSACLLLEAKVVLIGGGVAAAFRHLAPAVRRVLAERPALTGSVSVRNAELGTGAGAIGAAIFAAMRADPGRYRVRGRHGNSRSGSSRSGNGRSGNGRSGQPALATWIDEARDVLDRIDMTQGEALERAAEIAADAIGGGGVVHTFGTGHSRIPVEELFPRYGSYPGWHPIVELSLTYHTEIVGANGQRQAMFIERTPGLAAAILANFVLRSTDAIMIFSATGQNPVPVEMAAICREAGLKVIAVTSVAETRQATHRLPRPVLLTDHADVVIDLCTPLGDAVIDVRGWRSRVGPVSSIANVAIANTVKVLTAHKLAARGVTLPVITGSQVVGDEASAALFEAAYLEHARRKAAVLRVST